MAQTTTLDTYSAADIETNRAGRLSDSQRRYLRSAARSFSRSMLTGAVLAAVIGGLLATSNGPAPNAWARPAATAAFFLGALVCLFFAFRPNPEAGDASAGRVDAVEGAIGKRHYSSSSGNSSSTTYLLELGEKRYEVGRAVYDAAPDSGWVRLYVTPRSHKVVNFERLPDRVVPDAASMTPASLLGQLGSAFLSRDQQTRNETRAEMEAMARSLKAQMAVSDAPATPPAASERDPRPLAQAILGTWKMGPMSVTFMPDGTMVATFLGGQQRQGHWSIGADGKLHADATGSPGAADAWIAGDTLTISQEGGAAAFHRAAN
ncbi:MAG: hypothetical protein ABSD62_02570 [Candidatus Limnocylindrales bacterium]|jgi:hypothetical protein